jgi:hypothetical protein
MTPTLRFLDRGMPSSWQTGTDPSAPLRRHPDHSPARGQRCDSPHCKSASPLPHEPEDHASHSKSIRFASSVITSVAYYDRCSHGLREQPGAQRASTQHHQNQHPSPQPPTPSDKSPSIPIASEHPALPSTAKGSRGRHRRLL